MKLSERDTILRDLWCCYGWQEKMTIHIRKTGETLILKDGFPFLEQSIKTTDTSCAECGKPLPVRKTKFCSTKCNSRFHARIRKERLERQAEEALKKVS